MLFAPRVKETSTTTGTGTLSLAGAESGFQSFVAAFGTGGRCYYVLVSGTAWEVGLGTVTDASPDTLSRDVLLASSTGAFLNLGAGSKTVFCDVPGNIVESAFRDNRNAILNGDFEIWQDGTSFAAIANATYFADMWLYLKVTTGAVHTVGRSTDVPTVAQAGVLAPYSLLVDCTTADAVVDAADQVFILHRMEGYRWRTLAQRPCVLSFWVKATKIGTHCVGITNSGSDRYFIAEYTVNVTNTWEFKTIAIPASPSGGTWDYMNGRGVQIAFILMAGTNSHGTAGSWQTAGALYATANQVNACDNAANDFRLALVQMEPGDAPSPYVNRWFHEKLHECRRYLQMSFDYGTAPAQNAGTSGVLDYIVQIGSTTAGYAITQDFRPPMRATPTMTLYNPSAANAVWRNGALGADSGTPNVGFGQGDKSIRILNPQVAGDAAGHHCELHWRAEARVP